MDTAWKVMECDLQARGWTARMEHFTPVQQDFYARWTARCYELNGGMLFGEGPNYRHTQSWSACGLQTFWEDLMSEDHDKDTLGEMLLSDRPSIKCGALAWINLADTCPDRTYPDFLGARKVRRRFMVDYHIGMPE
jgi:hypothetical protein